jgi:hypothetical protein
MLPSIRDLLALAGHDDGGPIAGFQLGPRPRPLAAAQELHSYKAKLRRLWLHEESKSNMTAKEKRRATIDRAIKAWDEITTESVIRSFEKAIPRD